MRLGAALAAGAGFPTSPQTRTAAYTAVSNDFVRADVSGGAFTITLPAAPAVGVCVAAQKLDATANVVTVLPAGGGSINSDPNATIKSQWAGGVLEHLGANVWTVVAQFAAGGATGPTGPSGGVGPQGLGIQGIPGLYAPAANARTASYTLVLTDAATKFVTVDTVAGATLTVPPNSAVPFPVNTLIEGAQLGTGQLTIVAGAGVTLLATPGLKVLDRYGTFGLYQLAVNTWLVYGRLSA